jgi:hypothetical protein
MFQLYWCCLNAEDVFINQAVTYRLTANKLEVTETGLTASDVIDVAEHLKRILLRTRLHRIKLCAGKSQKYFFVTKGKKTSLALPRSFENFDLMVKFILTSQDSFKAIVSLVLCAIFITAILYSIICPNFKTLTI